MYVCTYIICKHAFVLDWECAVKPHSVLQIPKIKSSEVFCPFRELDLNLF